MSGRSVASSGLELALINLRAAGRPLTAQEVAEKIGFPLAGAFDLLYRLRGGGLVEQLDDGTWNALDTTEGNA